MKILLFKIQYPVNRQFLRNSKELIELDNTILDPFQIKIDRPFSEISDYIEILHKGKTFIIPKGWITRKEVPFLFRDIAYDNPQFEPGSRQFQIEFNRADGQREGYYFVIQPSCSGDYVLRRLREVQHQIYKSFIED